MPTTRIFTEAELDEHDIGPWSAVAFIPGDKHRWYTVHEMIFEHEGRHWSVSYMDPATENQDGQDRYNDPDNIVATEVHKVPVTVEQWKPAEPGTPLTPEEAATVDHAADPAVKYLINALGDDLHEMADGGAPGSEDAPFGTYATSETDGNIVTIKPDDDPDNWVDPDTDERYPHPCGYDDKGIPVGPIVRATYERIG